jgi:hypothetical protein
VQSPTQSPVQKGGPAQYKASREGFFASRFR